MIGLPPGSPIVHQDPQPRKAGGREDQTMTEHKLTGVCGKDEINQVAWEIIRRENGVTELTFRAEAGTDIPDYAYELITKLPPWAEYKREITEITLDSRIKAIGAQCFRGMDRLKKVRFLTDKQQRSHLERIGAKAFYNCRQLTEIQIPDSVEVIGNSAFEDSERLYSVQIGEGLTAMGDMVFANCVCLKQLRISSLRLEKVGKQLFRLNHALHTCVCAAQSSAAKELLCQAEQASTSGSRQSSSDAAEDGSMAGMLTDTVQYCLAPIREDAYCLEITGTGPMPEWDSRERQPWKEKADRIIEVKVAQGITTLGDYAFCKLIRLSRVCLPNTLRHVGIQTFAECAGVTEFRFPEGVESIGCRALWACANLKALWLPKTFRVADLFATAYCPALQDVWFAGSDALWKKQVFVDNMMEKNNALCCARMHFGEQSPAASEGDLFRTPAHDKDYQRELQKLSDIIKSGGDGFFHAVSLNLGGWDPISKVGDSTLLIFPAGTTMLIDTGYCGVGKYVVAFLRALDLGMLDYLVFTHPHGDHFGGAIELMDYLWNEKKGGIREVWYSGAKMDKELVALTMKLLKEKGVVFRQIKVDKDCAGERPAKIVTGGVEISVYGPNEYDIQAVNSNENVETSNDVSLVLRFLYGKTVFLTCGDIYRNKEQYLLKTYGPECFRADVLKMNHHGNYQGNIQPWVSATRPQIAYAETDGNGNSGVMRRYTEAGAVCYSTGMDGLLHITMGKEKDVTVFHQYDSSLRATNEALALKPSL